MTAKTTENQSQTNFQNKTRAIIKRRDVDSRTKKKAENYVCFNYFV